MCAQGSWGPDAALDLPPVDPLPEDVERYFEVCREKLGMVPNVLAAYAFAPEKLRAFSGMYNDLMLADSGLTKLEREMIAVAVSSVNRCFYCLTAHGAAVRPGLHPFPVLLRKLLQRSVPGVLPAPAHGEGHGDRDDLLVLLLHTTGGGCVPLSFMVMVVFVFGRYTCESFSRRKCDRSVCCDVVTHLRILVICRARRRRSHSFHE